MNLCKQEYITEYLIKKYDKVLFNTEDLQTILGLGRDATYELMNNSTLPKMIIGGRKFVSAPQLEYWLCKIS